jgi:hypothetical protein
VTKPVPFTVRVKAAPVAVAELGLSEVMTGGGLTVNGKPFEVTPPDKTVIVELPALAKKLAETAAASCVALPKVVGTAAAFHWTAAPGTKPLPFTVSVKAGPSAVAELGLSDVRTGGGLMVNGVPFEVTPPDVTVTVALPWLAMRPAGTEVVSCVGPIKVAGKGLPFHCIVAPDTKPMPFTAKGKAAPPAVAEFGFKEEMTGLMAKETALEITPCKVIATVAVPTLAMRVAGMVAVS